MPSSSAGRAARAAEVVEKATGTADLTKLDGRRGSGRTGEGKVTVTAPATADGDVLLDAPNADVSLGLPEAKGTEGVAAGAGTVVYPDAAPSTDIAVQPTSDGAARTLVTLKDRNAPTTHDFSLKLPEGTRLTEDGENGFLITKSHGEGEGEAVGEDTEILGAVDAPWAKDANGNAVPTRYRLDGDKLTQTVDVTADTAFPVVADPKVSLGWSIYLRFSKKEVKDMAKTPMYHFAAVATVMACAKIPNAVAAAGCGAALTAQASAPAVAAAPAVASDPEEERVTPHEQEEGPPAAHHHLPGAGAGRLGGHGLVHRGLDAPVPADPRGGPRADVAGEGVLRGPEVAKGEGAP
ncbi:hypothetical protein ABZV77_32320 [Streptomyces sp. NPDC004732]|uniref:hypothetical protein n=1 Tax=Streptomyces sp. NPDC004732 TaxID=3154290 RepID=UPI0033B97AF2